MKKSIVLLFLSFLFSIGSLHAQKIKGSDTVLPISQEEAESYMNKKPGSKVTVTGGGSGVGFSALIDGTCDIAMASRTIKFGEKMKLKTKKQDITEVKIAYDALAVVINPSNTVSKLTREQLEGIFTGTITNWKQVGGKDLKIVVYSRETSSGTYEFFKEHVLKNKNYMKSILSMPATGAIIQSVSQTKGAIGYVGLAYVSKRVKAVAVSYDGKKYATPSLENAAKKLYPIVRPLFYYYNNKDKNKVLPFIQYVLSPEGQNLIKKGGYIPIRLI
jgi:phosphate transport system substrate-binding protein